MRTVQVSQERLLQYIHFNRHHNTMLIDDAVKKIEELKEEIAEMREEIAEIRQDNSSPKTPRSMTDSPVVEERSHQDFPIVWDQEEFKEEEEEE